MIPLLLLLACGGKTEPCGLANVYADQDGDGFGDPTRPFGGCDGVEDATLDATDCDDADPNVHPGAPELCGDVDHDCDGTRNDLDATDAGTWYADYDHDGYGDPSAPTTACSMPPAHVSDATDCGPTDPEVHPGATERCDDADVDEDCDGLSDNADPGADGATIGYLDEDGDGWGSTTRAASCEAGDAIVEETGDCDDADATTWPGAPRVCGDGGDHDCDGFSDDDDADADGFLACEDCDDADPLATPDGVEVCDGRDNDCDGEVDGALAIDAVPAAPDADGDGYGDAAGRTWSCGVPEGWVDNAEDCDDGAAAVNPEGTETCATEADDDCDGETNEVGARACVDHYVDPDGDGYGDGAPRCQCAPDATYTAAAGGDCDESDPAISPGAPEVCLDGVDQDCDGTDFCPVESLDVVALGPADSHSFAGWAATGGDLTGDGVVDLVVGDTGASGYQGEILVYPGPLGGGGALPTWTVSGTAAAFYFGARFELADLDGDGIDDLVTGSDRTDWTSTDSGATFVHLGPLTGDTDVTAAALVAYGASGSGVGELATVVADVTDDGVNEIATGSMWTGSYGLVAIVPGDLRGDVDVSSVDDAIVGSRGDDPFSSAVADTDWNGDGVTDLAVGARYTGTAGVVYLYEGPVVGRRASDSADGTWEGGSSSEYFGTQLDAPGDVDGDGLGDLVGRASEMAALLTAVGTGTIAMSDSTATFTDGVNLLESPLAWGDFDGDGTLDLFFGASITDAYEEGVSLMFTAPLTGRLDPDDAAWASVGAFATVARGRLGDVDGDGRDDALIGSEYLDGEAAGSGAILLVPGSALP